MEKTDLYHIIAKGILAPSADNLQPWKFRLEKDQVDLFLDLARIKNFCDEGYLIPYLSAGAVIENMRVTAAQQGYRLSVAYFPIKSEPLFVASIRFSSVPEKGHPHYNALDKRGTNRKFYQMSRKISISTYTKLAELVGSEKDFKLLWVKKEMAAYSKLCHLVGRADQLRFENRQLHQELMETIRFNSIETQKTKDGIDFKTLEIGLGGSFLFKLIVSWKWMKFLNTLGMSSLFNLYAQFAVQSAQAIGLLIAKSNGPIDYLHGGEIMEKLWHEITLQGLSIQPMEALPIFILNFNLTSGRNFTDCQKRQLKNLKRRFLSILQIEEQSGLILLFRIGYAPPPTARSLRRPLEDFLV